jgi:hypothetical protein
MLGLDATYLVVAGLAGYACYYASKSIRSWSRLTKHQLFPIILILAVVIVIAGAFSGVVRSSSRKMEDRMSKQRDQGGGNQTVPQRWSRQCNRMELSKGQWKAKTLPSPIYIPVRNKRCPGRDGINSTAANGTFHTHVWTPTNANASTRNNSGSGPGPHQCSFRNFDPADFCKVVNNATIGMVGDSLMTEIFHSLLHQLGLHDVVNAHYSSPKFDIGEPELTPICNYSATLAFGVIDPVTGTGNQSLSHFLDRAQPNVLLFNRGAHPLPDQELQQHLPTLLATLESYHQKSRSLHRTTRFIWKTTTTGHPKCWEYSKPNHNHTLMLEIINDKSLYTRAFHPGAPSFNWWDLQKQNQIMIDTFANMTVETEDFKVEIIDGWDILLSRPDLHRGKIRRRYDCLHHCYPGPHDVFPQLLNHYLHMTPDEIMAGS